MADRIPQSICDTESHNELIYVGGQVKDRRRSLSAIDYLESTGEPARISEEQLHALIKHHHAVMLLIDPDSGSIVDANQAASGFYGYSMPGLCKMNISNLSLLTQEQIASSLQLAKTREINYHISIHQLANSEARTVEIHSSPIMIKDRTLLFTIVHDITTHKQCEEDLKTNLASIEELNTALKVVMQQIEENREELNEAIVSNIGELIFPSLEKLKKSQLSSYQLSILQSMESTLLNIASPFLQRLKMVHYKLTSREIEIATLVKEGRSNKEISELVNISRKTVEFHRNKLREKLKLKRKKVNLRSHLLTLT